MLIDANKLKCDLQGQTILKDISLHLERGEIYGLLGPNGAGKSTTIVVLLGLYPATGGHLQLFSESAQSIVTTRRHIGVMPEQAGFYDWMNASDYLNWYAGFYAGSRPSVIGLLGRVGLEHAAAKPIGQFSRGMKQRLALARALLPAPELLILDEPTNGLDPRGRREIHDLLLQLAEEDGVGVLLCTHLLDDVERLCGTIGIIDHGRSVAEGRLRDLLGQHGTAPHYRIRMSWIPEDHSLPHGLELLHHKDDWWYFSVIDGEKTHLAGLWEDLIVHGWGFSEIHADSGGLESLYLQLTTTAGTLPEEQAA